jgi:transcriptional regulator GlxA family with amidase domain
VAPEEWLRRERLRLARELLETTDHPIERVAGLAGFPSPAAMRAQFAARLLVSPRAYRRTFRQ